MRRDEIIDVRAYVVEARGSGGDYHDRDEGHWLIDTLIANPMSGYAEYKKSRTSWGIAVLGSLVVEIETKGGKIGVATGLGGPPACFMIEKHFRRFLVGADPRDINRIWDQIYRASMPYGRKGMTVAALSVVDLALWDLLGILRDEPVYALIGGATREAISLYCTGPRPDVYKSQGFWGGKVPLPHGPADGPSGLKKNVEFLAAHREKVGPDFPLMVDCYMSLDVGYAVALAEALKPIGIHWIEEALPPDDFDGHRILKERCPTTRWTTGEHEYTRYGFRTLIEGRSRRHPAARCHVDGRVDRGAAGQRHGGGLRYSSRAARLRLLQLSLRPFPAAHSLLRICQRQLRRATPLPRPSVRSLMATMCR